MRMTLYDYCAERDELVLLTQWAPVKNRTLTPREGSYGRRQKNWRTYWPERWPPSGASPRPNPGARDSGKPPDGLAGVSQRSYLEGRHLFQGGAAEVRLFPSAPGKSAQNGWNAVGGRWKNGNKMGPVSSNSRSGKS